MNHLHIPLRDIRFALFEFCAYSQHCEQLQRPDLDEALTMALLTQAAQFSEQRLAPLNASGDAEGCRREADGVVTPAGFKAAYREYCQAGWPGLARSQAQGGQGLPQSLGLVVSEIMGTGCWAWNMYVSLAQGVMHTLEAFASAEQQQRYLPHLVSGAWTGTMCLTEPQAGSDLAAEQFGARAGIAERFGQEAEDAGLCFRAGQAGGAGVERRCGKVADFFRSRMIRELREQGLDGA